MIEIVINNKCVTYNKIIKDLAYAIDDLQREKNKRPPKVTSRRQAYKTYGKGNVDNWLKQGKLKPYSVRKGKIEYKVIDLLRLHQQLQDYF